MRPRKAATRKQCWLRLVIVLPSRWTTRIPLLVISRPFPSG
nr:MAG TPA: hypothetical protein [Caudoviricetes sp.]